MNENNAAKPNMEKNCETCGWCVPDGGCSEPSFRRKFEANDLLNICLGFSLWTPKHTAPDARPEYERIDALAWELGVNRKAAAEIAKAQRDVYKAVYKTVYKARLLEEADWMEYLADKLCQRCGKFCTIKCQPLRETKNHIAALRKEAS